MFFPQLLEKFKKKIIWHIYIFGQNMLWAKVKILHVIDYYFPHEGGAERYCKLLALQHVKDGHKVTILTSDIASKKDKIIRHEVTPEGIEIYRMNSRMLPSRMPYIHGLEEKIREFSDYDLVHAHTPYPTLAWQVTEALRDMNIPLVTTHHCDYTRDKEFDDKYREFARVASKVFVRELFKMSDRIIMSTRAYAETSEEMQGFHRKLRVIPMCSTLPEKPGKVEKENYILFVGRLIWYKGVDHLVNAFSIIHKKHPHMRLKIVGRGPFLDKIKRIGRKRLLKYEDFIEEYLKDEELTETYKKAKVFVLPAYTRRESFGIVLVEAMSHGTPVVVYNIPGPNELVSKSGGGLIADVEDPFDLADKILQLIENEELYDQCREKGIKYVHRNLTPDVIARKTMKVYNSAINSHRKKRKKHGK
ncbi:MAG: glycosyltransferase [Candidatus Altiarchaeales archaeon]|nr:glycosyltransferase [Candidatus Altiarchaeales archaeon]MBD3416803.1 glycosyltransferase [Candidatus Altiarchaeales archaeon]